MVLSGKVWREYIKCSTRSVLEYFLLPHKPKEKTVETITQIYLQFPDIFRNDVLNVWGYLYENDNMFITIDEQGSLIWQYYDCLEFNYRFSNWKNYDGGCTTPTLLSGVILDHKDYKRNSREWFGDFSDSFTFNQYDKSFIELVSKDLLPNLRVNIIGCEPDEKYEVKLKVYLSGGGKIKKEQKLIEMY